MLAVKHAKFIVKDRIESGKALLFTDKILAFVREEDIPEGVEVIDAEGGYVAPGFIDLHIHGYLGRDVCDASEESMRIISKGLLENGVTGYLPTTMTVDMKTVQGAIDVCRKLMGEDDFDGSAILTEYYGRYIYLTEKEIWLFVTADDVEAAREEYGNDLSETVYVADMLTDEEARALLDSYFGKE